MCWTEMSMEEFASLEKTNGAKLLKTGDVWWREVRPFFYRPLKLFCPFEPRSVRPPLSPLLNSYQHSVASPDLANSMMHSMILDNLAEYSISELSQKFRRNIKHGMKLLQIRIITDPDQFSREAYPLYQTFYKRTSYSWNTERSTPEGFRNWAYKLFRFPKLLFLGAYSAEKLHAISISYLVEDIIIYSTYFSSDESLHMDASDLMLHALRTCAVECGGARYMFLGPAGSKPSLDTYKMRRGGKILSEPAYLCINAFFLYLIKKFRRDTYHKLLGTNLPEVEMPPSQPCLS